MNRRNFIKSALATSCVPSLASAATASHGPEAALTHTPAAKHIIHLFMSGGPSPQDLFDYKPALKKVHKQEFFTQGNRKGLIKPEFRITGMTSGQKSFPACASMFDFKQHGQSGAWVSELLPHTARIADDLCFIKSVHTEHINHDPAVTAIQTGSQLAGRPSLGSWLSYALKSMNNSLPDYFVMTPSWTGRKPAQAIYSRLWGAGFLPSKYQGVPLRSGGDPVLYLSNPAGLSGNCRDHLVDGISSLNKLNFNRTQDPETLSRSAQYLMARRMQDSIPELTDLSNEPKSVLDLYGPEVLKPGTFANSCLMARRMIERGVRTVQLFHRGWDQHANLPGTIARQCSDTDHATFGLITDLKQRGLLDDTLVVWGGEFGRTSYCQGKITATNYGRDHHPGCFTMWMAGAGVKAGTTYGSTDEFCYKVAENPVSINDLNATILHLLGIDHQKLSVRHQGLDFKLTGVEGARVVKEILI